MPAPKMLSSSSKFESFEPADENPSSFGSSSYDILAQGTGGTASDLKKWAKIRRLTTSCKMYKNIVDYVKNSSDGKTITVNRIYNVQRHGEKGKINENFRLLLWHGTSPSSIPGIIQTGFRMGSGGLFGGGIYFADRIAKSIGYTSKNPSGVGYLIIAEVFPGRSYKAHHFHSDYSTAPNGFDSVKGNGSRIPTWKDNQKYNGAILPCGPTRQNPRHDSYDMTYSEYIVYDRDRIIIRFVVECTF